MVESPSSQPKGPEQQYYVSALQYGRVVLIKENVATRGQNMQERERERVPHTSQFPYSEIQEVC